jgi:hypothetical protein
MEEQREIDRRSMEAIIEQPLGDVKGSHTCRLIAQTVKDEFVLAD